MNWGSFEQTQLHQQTPRESDSFRLFWYPAFPSDPELPLSMIRTASQQVKRASRSLCEQSLSEVNTFL